MNNLTDAIKHLIIINVIFFIAPLMLKIDLSNILALNFPLNEHFGIWQYFTYAFMHADITHIFFNMLFIWMFGSILEQTWGKNKFLFFYFSAAIGAAIIYTGINYFRFNQIYEIFINAGLTNSEVISILKAGSTNDIRVVNAITQEEFNKIGSLYNSVTVGASGALYGIFAASAVMFPNMEIRLLIFPIPLKNSYYMLTLILSDLFLGVISRENDNIARFAHVGGALVGGLIAWYWKQNQFKIK
jgi:membrane associated rhomboid family serine protease